MFKDWESPIKTENTQSSTFRASQKSGMIILLLLLLFIYLFTNINEIPAVSQSLSFYEVPRRIKEYTGVAREEQTVINGIVPDFLIQRDMCYLLPALSPPPSAILTVEGRATPRWVVALRQSCYTHTSSHFNHPNNLLRHRRRHCHTYCTGEETEASTSQWVLQACPLGILWDVVFQRLHQ